AARPSRGEAFGAQGKGCPKRLAPLPKSYAFTNGASVVHAGASDDGFRFVRSGQINAANGSVEVLRLDTGASAVIPVSLTAPQDHAAVASASGDAVLVAFAREDIKA